MDAVHMDRDTFMGHLREFMEKRGYTPSSSLARVVGVCYGCVELTFCRTPIDRIPFLGHKEIDLHHLYKEVTARGGLNEVLNKKAMKEVASTFKLPSTCTSAGYALRVHYLVVASTSPTFQGLRSWSAY